MASAPPGSTRRQGAAKSQPGPPSTPERKTSTIPGTPSSAVSSSNITINKSEDIRVICRVRPALADENTEGGAVQAVKIREPNAIAIENDNGAYDFAFDAVLGPQSTQIQVFNTVGKNVVDCVMDGFNATVFAYGQTSAGKTHTMVGTEADPGIIVRFAEHLFERIENSATWLEYSVQVQYVEIYLERVRDLLEERSGMVNPPKQQGLPPKQNLQIREDPSRGVHIPDATTQYVCNAQELLRVCEIARLNRATSETLMNQVSSRSHSVLLLFVTQKDTNTGSSKTSKINLVDLAGSEAVKRSGAEGDRLTEAQAINSSLSALGNVIHALTSDKTTYVPYRDSKLTRLLQESLGGNAKTWLIVNISPSMINASETLSTLRFGQRAKSVKNRAVINQVRSVQELEEALKHAQERIAKQEEIIASLQQHQHLPQTEEQSDEAATETTTASMVELQLENAHLQEQLREVTRERDEARQGWEQHLESAATAESEARTEIADLRTKLEAALGRIADLESAADLSKIIASSSSSPSRPSSPTKPAAVSTSSAVANSSANTPNSTSPPSTPVMGQTQQMPSPQKKLPSELRLDQLIQVHRQLLRKYAALELAVAETKQALSMGDERIRFLTRELATARTSATPASTRVAKVLRGGGGGHATPGMSS